MSGTGLLSIVIIAFSLAVDCFAVAVGGGVSRRIYSRIQVFKAALSFGVFQALMLLVGWLAGRTVVEYISAYDHWLAAGLLVAVGSHMVWGSFHEDDDKDAAADITRGLLLLTLSIATSIDSLAVGLTFAFLKVNISLAAGIVGFVAFMVTLAGFWLGGKLSNIVGKRAEMIGGLVLIAIAIRILLENLL